MAQVCISFLGKQDIANQGCPLLARHLLTLSLSLPLVASSLDMFAQASCVCLAAISTNTVAIRAHGCQVRGQSPSCASPHMVACANANVIAKGDRLLGIYPNPCLANNGTQGLLTLPGFIGCLHSLVMAPKMSN